MLSFILGTLFGGTVGVFAMCLCTAAKIGDMNYEINYEMKDKEN